MDRYHKSVLLHEVIDVLQVGVGKKYIDATAGDGGHSLAIASLGSQVLAIDQDKEAIARFKNRLESQEPSIASQVHIVYGNFADCDKIARREHFDQVDGILFDLGVSSYQLEESGRGFSFQGNEYLDMRMDKDQEMTAAEILAKMSLEDLVVKLTKYGEEPYAWEIAHMITAKRKKQPITTTKELSQLVAAIYKSHHVHQRIHPATRVFQALRIAVNQELEQLSRALRRSVFVLKDGGRVAVISFHSLEDRMVKQFMRSTAMLRPIYAKPIIPTRLERNQNPRARSAKLRIAVYEP